MSEPKFKHLLEPLKIGNYVLKNRMCVSNSLPFRQGDILYQKHPLSNSKQLCHFLRWSAKGIDGANFFWYHNICIRSNPLEGVLVYGKP